MPFPIRASYPPEHPFPPHPGFAKPQPTPPPVPIVYETSELEKISLRTYAAIHLRVPDSGIDWLDEMIRQSRELDSAGAAS